MGKGGQRDVELLGLKLRHREPRPVLGEEEADQRNLSETNAIGTGTLWGSFPRGSAVFRGLLSLPKPSSLQPAAPRCFESISITNKDTTASVHRDQLAFQLQAGPEPKAPIETT
jgi:hypothetical protein